MNDVYDLIIVGSGPAGLAASIYASRYKLNHLVIGETPGGQGILAGMIENYPGFISLSGSELMQKFLEHAKSYEVVIKQEMVKELVAEKGAAGEIFAAQTESGKYQAKSLILATGASYKSLGIPGEKEFIGKGVSFCTNCDAPFFKGKTVAVIGGGNSAISGALHVAEFADKVYLVHRRNEFRAEPYRIDK
ncbi:MAG: FAD-dependent oxidoreductase, partial [bacterium]|nr:FAD-dependent oxidoreductase [bacterium]